jgi:hypothetical protein
MDESPTHRGNLLYSKLIFTITSGLVFDQTPGHDGLAKLAHKINHHISDLILTT